MMRPTASWINKYRELVDARSKIGYLRGCDRDNLREIFRNIPLPRCIFANMVELFDVNCNSLEDLTWVQTFMVNLREWTSEFDAEVLSTCLETTSVRLERLSRRLK